MDENQCLEKSQYINKNQSAEKVLSAERKQWIERKRRKEEQTVQCMIEIYCHGNHHTKRGDLCDHCRELMDYAAVRTKHCPFMEEKTFCSACQVHCYSKEMQERIKGVMRYAGPRMLLLHPVLALRHVKITLQQKKKK